MGDTWTANRRLPVKINPAELVGDRNSAISLPLSVVLIQVLDSGGAPSRDEARQMGRLADKIADADGPTELTENEIGLIENALDRSIAIRPIWLVERLEYLLWPHKLAESDRTRLEQRYAKPISAELQKSGGTGN
jgi:hypothetical protein